MSGAGVGGTAVGATATGAVGVEANMATMRAPIPPKVRLHKQNPPINASTPRPIAQGSQLRPRGAGGVGVGVGAGAAVAGLLLGASIKYTDQCAILLHWDNGFLKYEWRSKSAVRTRASSSRP